MDRDEADEACVALAYECPDVENEEKWDYIDYSSTLNRELSADLSHAQVGSDSLRYSRCWFSLGA